MQLRKLNVMNDIVNNQVTDIWVLCGKPCDCNGLVNFSFIAFASYSAAWLSTTVCKAVRTHQEAIPREP